MSTTTAESPQVKRVNSLDKVVRVGTTKEGNLYCRIQVYGNHKYDDKRQEELSITGVVGPMRNGDARGGCGQIVDSLKDIVEFAPGWTAEIRDKFQAIWNAWHLNGMRPGCEHQRAMKWDERPIDPAKPLNAYGKHYPGQSMDSWNMLTWIPRKDHPEGLLSHPCPVCGYKYGSSWLHEPLPQDVVDFLKSLPDTDIEPAWV